MESGSTEFGRGTVKIMPVDSLKNSESENQLENEGKNGWGTVKKIFKKKPFD